MSSNIYACTNRERAIAADLRAACLRAIESTSEAEVCRLLGLKSLGLRRLVAETEWDLRVAVRAADCLDLEVIERFVGAAVDAAEDSLRRVS